MGRMGYIPIFTPHVVSAPPSVRVRTAATEAPQEAAVYR
jgi:hypothetical protein